MHARDLENVLHAISSRIETNTCIAMQEQINCVLLGDLTYHAHISQHQWYLTTNKTNSAEMGKAWQRYFPGMMSHLQRHWMEIYKQSWEEWPEELIQFIGQLSPHPCKMHPSSFIHFEYSWVVISCKYIIHVHDVRSHVVLGHVWCADISYCVLQRNLIHLSR